MHNDKDRQILCLKDAQILWPQLKKSTHLYCTGVFVITLLGVNHVLIHRCMWLRVRSMAWKGT